MKVKVAGLAMAATALSAAAVAAPAPMLGYQIDVSRTISG